MSGEMFSEFSESVARASAEAEPAKGSESQRDARFAEPENRPETGGDAGTNEVRARSLSAGRRRTDGFGDLDVAAPFGPDASKGDRLSA